MEMIKWNIYYKQKTEHFDNYSFRLLKLIVLHRFVDKIFDFGFFGVLTSDQHNLQPI